MKNGHNNNENGQAIAEMVVSLIGIMAVFLGVLFVAGIGVENIKVLLDARGEADENAVDGVLGDSGEAISRWEAGGDGLYFTIDDTRVGGGAENSGYFAGELESDAGDFSLVSDLDDDYVQENFAATLPGDRLFLTAANLTSHQSVNEDPVADRGLSDLNEGFSALFGVDPDMSLSETVYMPIQ